MVFQKENPQHSNALAGESDEGLDGASALPVRLARYHKARRRTLLMRAYIAKEQTDKRGKALAERMGKCGSWLLFRDYYRVEKLRLVKADFCMKHLLCPFCAIRRGAKAMKAYLDKLILIRQAHPNVRMYLVTLTVKNGEDLGERFRHITQSHKVYLQQRRSHLSNPIKNPHVEYAKAIGGVGSYECKRGSGSGLWHPHLHMIWLCYEQPDEQKIKREWEAITGDSFMCNVTPFRDDQPASEGFAEVFKYALKFSDMPLEDNWHAFKLLTAKRLLFSFGEFRGVDVPDGMAVVCLDVEPYVELLF